jgi:anti-sigma factor RsiW
MSADEAACKSMGLLLGAHLDGELDPVKTLEVEGHIAACEVCRERLALDRALRGSLKKAVKTNAPSDVRARMLAAMAGESARETRRDEAGSEPLAATGTDDVAYDGTALDASFDGDGDRVSSAPPSARTSRAPRPPMLRHWRTMLPLASAAALMMAWGAASKQPVVHGQSDTMVPAGLGGDMLPTLVNAHRRQLPPESQDPKQVRNFERWVGVPVHVPQLGHNSHFVGGRLVQTEHGDNAAMLQYEMQQGPSVQRVTLFVYQPKNIQVGTRLSPRAVGTAEVRMGQTDGYSVAVTQNGGVGYTITSDMDPESLANLVAVVDRGNE